jgi:outer membrane protein assembly factor BamB
MVACFALACSSASAPPPHDYAAGTQSSAPWPVIGHDEGYTSRAPVRAARSPNVAWKFDTGAFVGTASPVIAADGTVYIGNGAGTFVAVRGDGSLAWKQSMGGIEGAAAIARDGAVYVASDDAHLHVLAADGTEIASSLATDSLRSSVVLDDMGVAYFTLHGAACSAARAGPVTCANLAAYEPYFSVAPLFGIANHRLYVALYGGLLATYDTLPPDVDAGTPVAQGILGAITDDGTTYVVSNGRVESHDATGAYLWSCDVPGWPQVPYGLSRVNMAVASSNSVVLATKTGVVSLGPAGVAWSVDVGAAVAGALAMDSEGAVYFGASDGKLYAFDATGAPIFTVATGGPIRSTPAIGASGVVYFGSDDGFLYAVGP